MVGPLFLAGRYEDVSYRWLNDHSVFTIGIYNNLIKYADILKKSTL